MKNCGLNQRWLWRPAPSTLFLWSRCSPCGSNLHWADSVSPSALLLSNPQSTPVDLLQYISTISLSPFLNISILELAPPPQCLQDHLFWGITDLIIGFHNCENGIWVVFLDRLQLYLSYDSNTLPRWKTGRKAQHMNRRSLVLKEKISHYYDGMPAASPLPPLSSVLLLHENGFSSLLYDMNILWCRAILQQHLPLVYELNKLMTLRKEATNTSIICALRSPSVGLCTKDRPREAPKKVRFPQGRYLVEVQNLIFDSSSEGISRGHLVSSSPKSGRILPEVTSTLLIYYLHYLRRAQLWNFIGSVGFIRITANKSMAPVVVNLAGVCPCLIRHGGVCRGRGGSFLQQISRLGCSMHFCTFWASGICHSHVTATERRRRWWRRLKESGIYMTRGLLLSQISLNPPGLEMGYSLKECGILHERVPVNDTLSHFAGCHLRRQALVTSRPIL